MILRAKVCESKLSKRGKSRDRDSGSCVRLVNYTHAGTHTHMHTQEEPLIGNWRELS